MIVTEIAEYLHAEELLMVEFLVECPALGFPLSPEQDDRTIPSGYHVMVPFWLAAIVGIAYESSHRIVQIVRPPWVRSLGPRINFDTERS
jgi:hypothetical protein